MRKTRAIIFGIAMGLLVREIPKWLKTRKELKESEEIWVQLDDNHLAKLAHDQEEAGLRIFTGGEDIPADAKVVGDVIPHGPMFEDNRHAHEWIAKKADELGISRSEMRRRAFKGFMEQDA